MPVSQVLANTLSAAFIITKVMLLNKSTVNCLFKLKQEVLPSEKTCHVFRFLEFSTGSDVGHLDTGFCRARALCNTKPAPKVHFWTVNSVFSNIYLSPSSAQIVSCPCLAAEA